MPSNFLLTGSLIVILSIILALGGLIAVRKMIDIEKLKQSHDVGGALLGVVGALYSVLLGLIVVDAMQQYGAARGIVEREANNLADVFILAKGMHEPNRSELQSMCINYTNQVISTEWSRMNTGNYCPMARSKAVELMSSLMDFEPEAEHEKAIYPQLVTEASQFWQNRQARISMSQKGVPAVEWTVLIAGAMITVFFTYFFVLEHFHLQLLMTSLVAGSISLNLTLLLYYAYPFSEGTGLQAKAFTSLQELYSSEPSKS